MKPTYDMVIAQQKDGICMDYGYLKTSSLHYSAAFENQQCAMVNMGSWFISTLEAYMKDAETKFNWGIVKYPHPAGAEAGSTLGTVTSLAINADSPKAEAAADFINWCVSEEGAQAIAKTGTFPGLRLRCYRRDHQVHRRLPRGQQLCGCTDHQQRLSGDALHPVRI